LLREHLADRAYGAIRACGRRQVEGDEEACCVASSCAAARRRLMAGLLARVQDGGELLHIEPLDRDGAPLGETSDPRDSPDERMELRV
jgi:hypothetical protein